MRRMSGQTRYCMISESPWEETFIGGASTYIVAALKLQEVWEQLYPKMQWCLGGCSLLGKCRCPRELQLPGDMWEVHRAAFHGYSQMYFLALSCYVLIGLFPC